MQILLNAAPHLDERHLLADHVKALMTDTLDRFGGQITRVEAHLTDANSPAKAGPDEVQCLLEARVVGLAPVVVREQAGTVHLALLGAAGKLQRAVSHALARQDPQRHEGHHAGVAALAADLAADAVVDGAAAQAANPGA